MKALRYFMLPQEQNIFCLLSLLKVMHIVVWNLIREKDTNDKQFFIRGNVKTECWPSLKLDNAIEEIKL